MEHKSPHNKFKVLGVWVNAVQIPNANSLIEKWIQEGERGHFVAVTGMHGVTEAQNDPTFKKVLNSANLVVPDGMPLVWLGRRNGYALKRRVYGPELMHTFCETTGSRYRHFFYGAAKGIPEQLAELFESRFGIEVAGTYSPPFRPLTPEEDADIIERINDSRADVLWVGLSTPKQEKWMYDHRDKLNVPVMIGVGAAFDIHTGRVAEAPTWMKEHGLQWLHRLLTNPRRLWRRYLIGGSKFVGLLTLELLRLKQFD